MKRLMGAMIVAGVVTAGTAGATTYVCKVKPANKRAWIPQTLIIDHNEKSGKVLVYDEIIKTFFDHPLPAKVAAENNKRITFKWALPEFKVPNGPTILEFDFRASYLKASHRIIVTSNPAGFDNEFTGRGNCQIKK